VIYPTKCIYYYENRNGDEIHYLRSMVKVKPFKLSENNLNEILNDEISNDIIISKRIETQHTKYVISPSEDIIFRILPSAHESFDLFTEVDVSDDILKKDKTQMTKPKVIDCIVKVIKYLDDQNHPGIYEKHKEILSDILNINDYM
jgi:hypothetical protein